VADVRAAIFAEVVARGWTLLELRSHKHSLESVYRTLVQDTPDFAPDSGESLDTERAEER